MHRKFHKEHGRKRPRRLLVTVESYVLVKFGLESKWFQSTIGVKWQLVYLEPQYTVAYTLLLIDFFLKCMF